MVIELKGEYHILQMDNLIIEASLDINNIILNHRDALEIVEEDNKIKSIETSHLLIIEMKKEEN